MQVAYPYDQPDKKIRTIAICAGSGASVVQGVEADLYFTGEMQHVRSHHILIYCRVVHLYLLQHEVLAAIGKNTLVVLCTFLSRSVYKDLPAYLKGKVATRTRREVISRC